MANCSSRLGYGREFGNGLPKALKFGVQLAEFLDRPREVARMAHFFEFEGPRRGPLGTHVTGGPLQRMSRNFQCLGIALLERGTYVGQ
jgi:hypothetical protein